MTTSQTAASNASGSRCEDLCSLPTDEMQTRLAMVRSEILPLVTRREALEDGMALEFEHSSELRKKLEDFVEFERECCSDLVWNLHQPSRQVLRLTIEGLAPESDFFFWARDDAKNRPASGRLARLAQASGLGAGFAFFVCCLLPIGVALVAGPAIAAPLGKLDDPLFIAAGSVLAGVPAWLWLRRRASRSARSTHSETASAGCGDTC